MRTPNPFDDPSEPPPPVIKMFGREFRLPRSRWVRVSIGVALCVFGVLGFLPILGFWMIPLGLLVLSYEFAAVRRFRRRMVVWWERRKRPANTQSPAPANADKRDLNGGA